MPQKKSYPTVTDQFCGAGGSSQGARRLKLEVQLAMNHDRRCIETHSANFPETEHDCADMSAVDPRRYWSTDMLITSPECTAHTYADGKKKPRKQMSLFEDNSIDPADERSRATMWDVPRFAEFHDYNIIVVENVVDAANWILFDDWLRTMHTLGYAHHIVYFNSMFAHLRPLDNPQHGKFAPQSRDRMYVVFWKRGNKAPDLEFRPLAWCPKCERDVEAVQTWRNTKAVHDHGGRWGRYGDRNQYIYTCPRCSIPRKWTVVTPYYYCAANAIDWTLPVMRIGDRDEPLKPKTMARIEKGLEMFSGQHLVIDLARTHGHDRRSVPLMRASLPTQTAAQTFALLMLPFTVETLFTGGDRAPRAVDEPLTTQTTRQSTAVVTPFLTSVNYFDDITRPVDGPLPTQTTGEKLGVTIPPFLLSLNHSTDRLRNAMSDVMATQMPQARNSLVIPPFLLGYANGDGPPRGVDGPLRTVHTENGQAVIIPPFMVQLRNNSDARGMDEPLGTFSAGGQHHSLFIPPFMMSYYGSSGSHKGVDEQMGTLTPVDRHALVQPGQQIEVEDCGFRMLEPHEIGRGMAFDDDYIVMGTKRDKVRQYGNAVTPPVMEMILERCVATFQ